MKRILLLSLITTLIVLGCKAQSSFPPKSFPSSIKVMTDAGVAQYWDVKRVMCIGPSGGGYKFKIYGKGAASHRGQNVKIYYMLPGNKIQTAGAYYFPTVKEGEPFNFEITSAFRGHAPQKFLGFMIKDEKLKVQDNSTASRQSGSVKKSRNSSDKEIEIPEEILNSVKVTQIQIVEENSVSNERSLKDFEITSNDLEITKKDIDEVFTKVDKPAEFPGGMPALMSWLSNNIRYPETAQSLDIQGKVVVKFIVEKDGNIRNISVVRSVDMALDKEAIRLVKAMPRWKPGYVNGEAVRCYFTLPINFRLTK